MKITIEHLPDQDKRDLREFRALWDKLYQQGKVKDVQDILDVVHEEVAT